ncbi:hypothetical protein PIB30_069219, partial [Stylosanthes scabra]|nr:hypothetical protein [Stylosanthes scabra]
LIWSVIVANPPDPVHVPDHSQPHIPDDVRSRPKCYFKNHLGFPSIILSFVHDVRVPFMPHTLESPLLSETGTLILKDPLTLFLTHVTLPSSTISRGPF